MVLMLISVTSLLFVLINLKLSNNDVFAPSVVFPAMFFVQAITCLFALTYLDLKFNAETLIILNISYFIFTFSTLLFKKIYPLKLSSKVTIDELFIPKIIRFLIIILFIVIIIFQYQRLNKIASAIGISGASLGEKISQFDLLIKFFPKKFAQIGIYLPKIISELIPIVQAFGYVIAYKFVNNFVKTKKFEIIDIVIISLFIVQLYFSGSRSPIFRLFTFIIVIYYFITTKSNMNKEQINRVVRKIILFAILLLIIFVASLNLFGRTNNYNGFHYLFIYLGAPLYNLSTFISSTSVPVQQEYFGQQTFISFYNYILPKFGLETITLDIPFVRYNGMYGLGNVYTTFYQFLYDFGAIGVPIFISIIAVYFSNNYFFTKVQREEKMKFSLSLFIYAYLFNDLIMLIFSNRFYETILHVSTLKLLFWVFIIKSTIIDKGFKIGKYKIVFNQ